MARDSRNSYCELLIEKQSKKEREGKTDGRV